MKNKIGNILSILTGIVMFVYLVQSSITDLTNKEDLHTVTIDAAAEVLQLEHSINGIIPIGTDYYYVGINEESYDAYLIMGPKKWLNKNFDSDNLALDPNGVQITGLSKKVSDNKVARELETRLSQLEGLNYPLGELYCVNMQYQFISIIKLIAAALLLFLAITGAYIVPNKDNIKQLYINMWTTSLFIFMALLIVIFAKA